MKLTLNFLKRNLLTYLGLLLISEHRPSTILWAVLVAAPQLLPIVFSWILWIIFFVVLQVSQPYKSIVFTLAEKSLSFKMINASLAFPILAATSVCTSLAVYDASQLGKEVNLLDGLTPY